METCASVCDARSLACLPHQLHAHNRANNDGGFGAGIPPAEGDQVSYTTIYRSRPPRD
jgi:hypothetical protein